MISPRPLFTRWRLRSVLSHGAALIALAALTSVGVGRQIQPDAIPVKNWPTSKASAQAQGGQGGAGADITSGLVYIAITPCRVMDTRGEGGSGKTGAFGPPALLAGPSRVVPVPSSNCGVPVAAAYSMNFVSVTPAGQAVGWVAAWQDDIPWPGTVVLNATLGGIINNAALVPAGADGGIQVMATHKCDPVIDMNGYFVQDTTPVGASRAPRPTRPLGPARPLA